ncbi:hypothetical protein Bca52824_024057 [Brassica carinata]|uniref:BZIP domain-containing protein n=1 Tax=Brassica carinata TaxID=52824 RepID=A0A8X7VJH3_BRACI|nr:hypothetical protein Bca52824_024057 [Brassica carinata]
MEGFNGSLAEYMLKGTEKLHAKERKAQYTAELEHKVSFLQTEATTLLAQLRHLQRDLMGLHNQNSELRFRLQAMEQQLQLLTVLVLYLNSLKPSHIWFSVGLVLYIWADDECDTDHQNRDKRPLVKNDKPHVEDYLNTTSNIPSQAI